MKAPTIADLQERAQRSQTLRALLIYVSISWGILQGVDFFTDNLGLPDWVFSSTVVLLLVGLPITLATAIVQSWHAQTSTPEPLLVIAPEAADAPEADVLPAPAPTRQWLTWKNTIGGGVMAFALLGTGTGSYMGLRALGIGPVGTLMAAGVIERSDQVLVAEFDNRTDQKDLGQTVAQALAVDLSQSRVVRVIEPRDAAAALKRMEKDPGQTPLTAELAREVAQREGIKAVLEGSVSSLGTATVITARLVSAKDGAALAEYQEIAKRPEDLLGAVDRLSTKLRDKIGESLRVIRLDPPLEQVTTPSLEALRLYTAGVRADNVEGDRQKAIALWEQAIDADSTFAMAWRKLGAGLTSLQNQPARVQLAYSSAYRHRDRLTARERGHAAASYYTYVEKDLRKAAAAYENILATYPHDHLAVNSLGLIHLRLQNFAEAEAAFRRAIVLDSTRTLASTNLVVALAFQGKFDEAEAALRRAAKRSPNAHFVKAAGPTLAAMQGDYSLAEQRLRAILQTHPADPFWRNVAEHTRGSFAANHGRLAAAEQHARNSAQANEQQNLSGAALWDMLHQAEIELLRGRRAEAGAALRSALARYPLHSMEAADRPYWTLADLYARIGNTTEARAFVLRAKSENVPEPWPNDGVQDRVMGLIALEERNYSDAVNRLRASSQVGACVICSLFELGRAYEASGEPDAAIAAYERYTAAPDGARLEAVGIWFGPAYERLSALYEAKGDRQKAAFYASRLVELWKNADPELKPRVEAARERVRQLSS